VRSHNVSSHNDKENAQNQIDQPIRLSVAELEQIPSAISEYEASSKKQSTREGFRLFIEIAGLLLVAITAYLAWVNLEYMRQSIDTANRATNAATVAANEAIKANTLARNNFIQDQRPYIFLAKVEMQPNTAISIGKQMFWRIEFGNYGRSAAINFSVAGDMFWGDGALATAYKWFDKPYPTPTGNGSIGILTPLSNGGKPEYSTPESPNSLTSGDVDFIKTHDYGVVLVGKMRYEDISGHVYWTEYCRFTEPTGAIAQCEEHNRTYEGSR